MKGARFSLLELIERSLIEIILNEHKLSLAGFLTNQNLVFYENLLNFIII